MNETKGFGGHWDTTLSDEEIEFLRKGVHPLLIQQDHLVSWWAGFGILEIDNSVEVHHGIR